MNEEVKWYFLDPSVRAKEGEEEEEEEGPLTSSNVISLILQHKFTGLGNQVQFRRETDEDYKPLSQVICEMAKSQFLAILKEILKGEAPPKEIDPYLRSDPFEISGETLLKHNSVKTEDLQPDLNLILLPPQFTALSEDDLLFGKSPDKDEHPRKALCEWVLNNKRVDDPCEALVIPVHSFLLKVHSPVIRKAIEVKEKREKQQLIDALTRSIESPNVEKSNKDLIAKVIAYLDADRRTASFSLIVSNTDALKIIMKRLYGSITPLKNLSPITLMCMLYEAAILEIDFIRDEAKAELSRRRNLRDLVILSSMSEVIGFWESFAELGLIFANSFCVILRERLYMQMGPLAFRVLISSDYCSVNEIQVFFACTLWLKERERSGELGTKNYLKSYEDYFSRSAAGSKADSSEMAEKIQKARTLSELVNEEIISDSFCLGRALRKGYRFDDCSLANKIFIYSGVRFSNMSAKELLEARIILQNDSLLIEGVLRKLINSFTEKRHVLWKENEFFDVDNFDGGFPVRLLRKNPDASRTQSVARMEQETRLRTGKTPFWAWTTGDPRPVSEATFFFIVESTKAGRVSVGISSPRGSADLLHPNYDEQVWYFNMFSKEFYSGLIRHQRFNEIEARSSFTADASKSWTRNVMSSDRVALQVSVGLNCLKMAAFLFAAAKPHEPQFRVSFAFPHRSSSQSLNQPGTRSLLLVKPWFELMDVGDTISIERSA